MISSEDPFIILGVRRQASLPEIKRAYRRLAMQWHPDRNPSMHAESQFRRLHAAYEALLDPQVLAAWRQAPTSETTTASANVDDLTLALTLTLEDAAFGCQKNVTLTHAVTCTDCQGSGKIEHDRSVPCDTCSGCGRIARQGGRTAVCSGCAGRGYLRVSPCPRCVSSGVRRESRILMVTVPPGVLAGEKLRLAGQAPPREEAAGAGDLYLEIHFADHPLFVLDGRDLHCHVPVSIFRLLGGGRFDVPTLRGTTKLELPPLSRQTVPHRLAGQGFPGNRKAVAGDLLVHLESIFPQELSADDIALLDRLDTSLARDGERRAPPLALWEERLRARRRL
ncbi:MAG TPA: J domain-containing protein [Accumulibacter sp.]|jgi:molecular chaperone DnaJ|nr:J domain-containing protein [Accumulibacter sp.]